MGADTVYEAVLPESEGGAGGVPRAAAYAIASVRVAGGHLLKLRHPPGKQAALRRFLRAEHEAGHLLFFIPGEELGLDNDRTVYLSEKYPAILSDPAYGARDPGVTLVCI